MAPSNEDELADMMATGIGYQGPAFVRYPRGSGTGVPIKETPEAIEIGKAIRLQDAREIDIWAIGAMVADAERLAAQLSEHGIKAGVINARFVKPLDSGLLIQSAQNCQLIVTMEDNAVTGGFGTGVLEALQDGNCMCPVERIGWPDQFVEHGSSVAKLRARVGLDPESILRKVLKRYSVISAASALPHESSI
jgi:1-deoxy-D-xylulose-5-phosphate synthase